MPRNLTEQPKSSQRGQLKQTATTAMDIGPLTNVVIKFRRPLNLASIIPLASTLRLHPTQTLADRAAIPVQTAPTLRRPRP